MQVTGRTTLEDVDEIGGIPLTKGQSVVCLLGSANRDPAVYANPDELDIRRTDIRPLSFGGGIHYCVGAQLARLEGEIAINTLLRRLPNCASTTSSIRIGGRRSSCAASTSCRRAGSRRFGCNSTGERGSDSGGLAEWSVDGSVARVNKKLTGVFWVLHILEGGLGRLGVSGLSSMGGGVGMRTPYSFAPANDRKRMDLENRC